MTHVDTHFFLLRMTDIVTSHNFYLSSWDILCISIIIRSTWSQQNSWVIWRDTWKNLFLSLCKMGFVIDQYSSKSEFLDSCSESLKSAQRIKCWFCITDGRTEFLYTWCGYKITRLVWKVGFVSKILQINFYSRQRTYPVTYTPLHTNFPLFKAVPRVISWQTPCSVDLPFFISPRQTENEWVPLNVLFSWGTCNIHRRMNPMNMVVVVFEHDAFIG
jgi:hypothetical protein